MLSRVIVFTIENRKETVVFLNAITLVSYKIRLLTWSKFLKKLRMLNLYMIKMPLDFAFKILVKFHLNPWNFLLRTLATLFKSLPGHRVWKSIFLYIFEKLPFHHKNAWIKLILWWLKFQALFLTSTIFS